MVSIKLLALACLITVACDASPHFRTHLGSEAAVQSNSGPKSSCSKSSKSGNDNINGNSGDSHSNSKSGCSGGSSGNGGIGGLVSGVTGKLSGVGGLVNNIKEGASNVVSGKLGAVGGVLNGVTGQVGTISSGVSSCGNTGKTTDVLDNVSHAKDTVTDTVKNVAADKVNILKDVTNAVSNKVKGVESTVKNVGSSVLEAAKDKVGGVVNAVKGVASNVGNTVSNVAKGVTDKVKDVGSTAKNVVSGAVKGVQDKVKGVTNVVQDVAKNVGNTVNKVTSKLSETFGSLYKGIGESSDSCGCQDAMDDVDRSDETNSIDVSFSKMVSISQVIRLLINQHMEKFGDYFRTGLVSIFKLHLCQLGSNNPVSYSSCEADNSFKSSVCQSTAGRNWLGYNKDDASDCDSLYQQWGLNSFRKNINSQLRKITNGKGLNSLDTLKQNIVTSCYKLADLIEKRTVEKEDIYHVYYHTALTLGSTAELCKKDSGKEMVNQLIDQCDGSFKTNSIQTLETKKTVIYEKIIITEESSSTQEVSSNESNDNYDRQGDDYDRNNNQNNDQQNNDRSDDSNDNVRDRDNDQEERNDNEEESYNENESSTRESDKYDRTEESSDDEREYSEEQQSSNNGGGKKSCGCNKNN